MTTGSAAPVVVEPRVALAKRLATDTHATWLVDIDDRNLVITRVGAPEDSSSNRDAVAVATKFIATYAPDAMPAHDFTVATSSPTRVTFEQKSGELAVVGGYANVVLDGQGVVSLALRYIADTATIDHAPAMDGEAIMAHLVELARGGGAKAVEVAPPVLVIAAPDHLPPFLGYRTTVTSDGIVRRVLVDASDGKLVAIVDRARDVAGSGQGGIALDGKTYEQRFEVAPEGNGKRYQLLRPATGKLPEIRVTIGNAVVTSADPARWDEAAGKAGKGAAVDAYAHMIRVTDFFATTLRWGSYDGKASPITIRIHVPIDNAHWTGTDGVIAVGEGGERHYAALDVLGHEFMHGVLQALWGDENFPGREHAALDEAIGDVFGAMVEHADTNPRPHQNYEVGEDTVIGGAIRSMTKPSSRGGVDHMSKYMTFSLWEQKGNLLSGNFVGKHHENAGIIDNAFYLMTQGNDENPISHIRVGKPITWDAATRIWWRAIQRMSWSSGFSELALDTISVASDSEKQAVACAWLAVGVIDRTVATEEAHATCSEGTPTDDILGFWRWEGWGKWGTMSFARVNGQIRGVYTFRDGTVVLGERGTDGWYRGCWSEASRDRNTNGDFGIAWFHLRNDGTLDGRWQHLSPQTWREDWDLARGSDRSVPADDKKRLDDNAQFVPCK